MAVAAAHRRHSTITNLFRRTKPVTLKTRLNVAIIVSVIASSVAIGVCRETHLRPIAKYEESDGAIDVEILLILFYKCLTV